jgi:uncharacterized protein
VTSLPTSLAPFGPAALASVVAAAYLVVGEPVAGHVLHRRFEGRLRTDTDARRSFYRRLLVLEWGLTVVVAVLVLASGLAPAQVGLRWPEGWPGPVAGAAALLVLLLGLVSTRALRGGALLHAPEAARRPGGGRHAEPTVHATLALLPRTRAERRLFTLVGISAGVCEEWLYRAFFLAVVSAISGGLPGPALVAVAGVAFGLAHVYQGPGGVLLTGVLGAVLAALYLDTGSLLLPVVLHALIDLRFLLVPPRALPSPGRVAW